MKRLNQMYVIITIITGSQQFQTKSKQSKNRFKQNFYLRSTIKLILIRFECSNKFKKLGTLLVSLNSYIKHVY